MAFNNPVTLIRSLVQLAVKTRIKCREVGGAEADLTEEATNLNCVLRRLLQEVSKPRSAFNRAGTLYHEELITLYDSCKVVLDKINEFLSAFETINHVEREIVGT